MTAAAFFIGVILGWVIRSLFISKEVRRAREETRRNVENFFHAHGVRDPRETTSSRIL